MRISDGSSDVCSSDLMLADREEIRLRGDVKSETGSVQFRIVNPPSLPTAPAAPNRPLLLLGVLVLGLGAGIGTAFAAAQLKGGFPNAARLEKALGACVIGSISQTVNAAQLAAEIGRAHV